MDANFSQFLQDRIGLAEPARNMLATHGGAVDVESFCSTPTAEFGDLWENLVKASTGIRVANEANRPIFPFPAKNKLFAFRLYCEYCITAELTDAPLNITAAAMSDWIQHIRNMKSDKDKDPDPNDIPEMKDLRKWQTFKELLSTHLAKQRNASLGVPLSYLIRPNDDGKDPSKEAFTSLDQKLIACIELHHKIFAHDNTQLYDLLKTKVVAGDLWSFIKPFDASKNGRGAYKALLNQAEGPAYQQSRVTNAYKNLERLHYSGKSRNFPFSSYVQRHQECHNILAEDTNEETLTESRKIECFLKGITDSRLATPIGIIRSQPGTYSTFEKVQQHLTSELDRMAPTKDDPQASFKVAGATLKGGKQPSGPPKQKGGKQPADKKRKRGSGFISHKMMKAALKAGGDDAVKQLIAKRNAEREEKKKAKVAAATVEKESTAFIQAINNGLTTGTLSVNGKTVNFSVAGVAAKESKAGSSSNPVVVDSPDSKKKAGGTQQELQQAAAKSASAQFGRAGRKGQKPGKKVAPTFIGPLPKPASDDGEAKVSAVRLDPDGLPSDAAIQQILSPKVQDIDESALQALSTRLEPMGLDFEAAEAKMALSDSKDEDEEDDEDSEEPSDTSVDAPYVAPSQGTKEEEELVVVEQSLAIELGLKDKIYNPDLEDTDDEDDVPPEDRAGPLLVQIRRKYLMEKDFSRFTFTRPVGETPADDIKTGKWVQQLLSATLSKVEFREQCSLFKGKLANEIKDPLLRLIVQATRYAVLHEEHHFNDDGLATEEDQCEFRVLNALRQFINKEAAGGNPEKVAELAVWQAATNGRANIQEINTLYKGSLRHAKKAIAANDQKFK